MCTCTLSPQTGNSRVTQSDASLHPSPMRGWGWCVEREGWLGGLEMITVSTAWETCCRCFWQARVFKRRGTHCTTYSSSQMAHWSQKSKPFPAYLFKLSKYLTEWMSSSILKTILHRRKDNLEIAVFPYFTALSRNGKSSLLVSWLLCGRVDNASWLQPQTSQTYIFFYTLALGAQICLHCHW